MCVVLPVSISISDLMFQASRSFDWNQWFAIAAMHQKSGSLFSPPSKHGMNPFSDQKNGGFSLLDSFPSLANPPEASIASSVLEWHDMELSKPASKAEFATLREKKASSLRNKSTRRKGKMRTAVSVRTFTHQSSAASPSVPSSSVCYWIPGDSLAYL